MSCVSSKQCCENCFYWRKGSWDDGDCRRSSPTNHLVLEKLENEHHQRSGSSTTVTLDKNAMWARTNKKHWCGEYRTKNPPRKKRTAAFSKALTFDEWAKMNLKQRLEWAMKQRWIILDHGNSRDPDFKVLAGDVFKVRPYGAVYFLSVRGLPNDYYHSTRFPNREWDEMHGYRKGGLTTTHKVSP